MRRVVVVAFVVLPVLFPLAAHAQRATFDDERPDARAPAGVLFGQLLPAGSFRVGYNFASHELDGLLTGGTATLVEEVLDVFPIAPATLQRQFHLASFGYGVNENLSVMALVPFGTARMGHLTRTGEAFYTESSGIGDLQLLGLYRLYSSPTVRAHVEGGISAPTGAIDLEDVTPTSAPATAQLPYVMQTGSGTVDLHPGATIHVMNEVGSVGAQVRGTFRLGENDRGYRFGDQVTASAWMAPRVNEFLSLSGRLVVKNWDGVQGADASLDPSQVPTAVSRFTGGTTVEIPFGVNLHLAEGPLRGHRLSIEAAFPIHQDYDGIQLEQSWSLLVGWEKLF